MALLSAIAVDKGTVLLLITIVVLPIAAVTFALAGPAWRGIGKGPFAIERELPRSQLPDALVPFPQERAAARPDSRAVQAAEVRQMIEAKSYRRQRRGEPPLDVEAETERELANLVGSA